MLTKSAMAMVRASAIDACQCRHTSAVNSGLIYVHSALSFRCLKGHALSGVTPEGNNTGRKRPFFGKKATADLCVSARFGGSSFPFRQRGKAGKTDV